MLEGRSKKRTRANEGMSAALVTTRGMGMPTLPVRLQWRGVEVSEEFQAYAARVARGEELAPYRGAVLARPCSEFQWSFFQQQQQQQQREATEPLVASPLAARSLRHAAWLFGIAGAMLAGIGIGSGAFSAQPSDGYGSFDSATVALTPVEPHVHDGARQRAEGSASLDDDASDEVAASSPRPAPSPRARRAVPSAGRRTVSPVAGIASVRPAPAPPSEGEALVHAASDGTEAHAASLGGATSVGLTAAGSAAPAPAPSEGFRTAALGNGVSAGASGFEGTGASTLFSDQPPF